MDTEQAIREFARRADDLFPSARQVWVRADADEGRFELRVDLGEAAWAEREAAIDRVVDLEFEMLDDFPFFDFGFGEPADLDAQPVQHLPGTRVTALVG